MNQPCATAGINESMPQDGPGSSGGTQQQYPRLSRPVELMRDSYDVVVIGSGYGGAVAASRMARGRQTVCVLEVGKERWPGEFPEELVEAAKEIHVSGEFAPGDRRGQDGLLLSSRDPTKLYHIVVGDGQNAIVGNGLGGTSLVNANVFLEAHPKVLDMGFWPQELRGHAAWEKYYKRSWEMLEPAEYPADYPELHKLNFLQQQAKVMGWEKNFYRTPQTTRFVSRPNSTGVPMKASTLTGMDVTGINDGSKSTTLVTYLSDAWNWGAEIFCKCEVRHIEKAPGREGYIVYFAWHGSERANFKDVFHEDLMWVHAKKFVFVGAGSLGSTEILLRSRQMGLDISDDIGTEMSGNGDMLAFGYNTNYDVNAVAHSKLDPQRPVGPCITGVIDLRDQENVLDGFVVEDAAIPLALAPILFPLFEKTPGKVHSHPGSQVEFVAKIGARIGSKLLGPFFEDGSVQKTATYLVMSHDSSQGRMFLKDDKPVLRYSGVGRSDSVSRINQLLSHATSAMGGTFVPNPAETILGGQQITVHPIGGARISKNGDGTAGVVNHMGQVLVGNSSQVYEGLIVCDSAIVPAAIGVNPFATITALAERCVELLALKHGIVIDYDTKNGLLDLFGEPAFPLQTGSIIKTSARDSGSMAGFSFTEIMSGFIHVGGNVQDFETAEKIARGRSEAARVFLSIKSEDLAAMIHDDQHVASLTGTFSCPGLNGPFIIRTGRFQLFSGDSRRADTKNFIYDFDMVSPCGTILHFNGYKDVGPAVAFDPIQLWTSTTSLFTTITDSGKTVVARGILQIHPHELVSEVKSLDSDAPSLLNRATSIASFLTFFSQEATSKLLGPLTPTPDMSILNINDIYAIKPFELVTVVSVDNVRSDLRMWRSPSESPDTPQILFIPGAAVDHQIFALPTIEVNAIDYFHKLGYRTYCLTHRIGLTPEAKNGHTTYDVRQDILAAMTYIRNSNIADFGQPQKVYVVAHGAGSIALSMGLLDGTIPSGWIAGITASNVFMHPKFGKTNHVLASMPLAITGIYEKFGGSWYDCGTGDSDIIFQQLLTRVVKLYPVGHADETCTSDVCHRSSLVFGRLWSHKNLNDATHANLVKYLGGTTMRSLNHLMAMATASHAITNLPDPEILVTPENIARLKGIPILFFSGSENAVFTPENTDMSYTTLSRAHGKEWYEREVFEGRGDLDCWMGATAFKDVYPTVERHARKVLKRM